MRHSVAALLLMAALAGCSSGPRLQLHPTGPTGVTPPASGSSESPSQEILPLRRGFLEIGTYGTEIFRPSFTIDIPVSSQWGTFGETGRRVSIGGPDGFFSFLALSAGGDAPLTVAALGREVSRPGARVSGVEASTFAGLPADQLGVVNGPDRLKVTFGGQHISFFPHEHATLWLLRVGSSPVLVVLGVGSSLAGSFRRQAMAALRSVMFESAP